MSMALALALLVQAPAAAPPLAAPTGTSAPAAACPANRPPLPAALSGWSARSPVTSAGSAGGLGAAVLPLGRGGMLALSVDAAGTYAVGLSSAAWIDVVDAGGSTVASSAHAPGPPCSGVRKVVDLPLAPGRYVVQLTASEPTVGVIAFRR